MFSIKSRCTEQRPRASGNPFQSGVAISRLSALAHIVLLFALSLPSTVNAQGTTDGVCGRTQQVSDKLVELAGADDCASVTAADLAAITTLDLDNTGLTLLQAGDFNGLTALVNLRLRDNELTLASFPRNLLKNLPLSIRYIDVSGNPGCPTHGEECFPPAPTIDVTVGTDTSGLTVARTGETVKLSLNDGGYRDPLGRSLRVPAWTQSTGPTANMNTSSDGRSASFIVPHISADENAQFAVTVEPTSNSGSRPWSQTVLNNFWKEASSQVDLTFAPPLPSSDTSLSELEIYGVTPRYDSSTETYELTVPNSVASVSVRARPRERNAVVEISPTDSRPAAGHQVSLDPGANSISITVTATDGVTTAIYTVTVTRDESAGVCGRTQLVSDKLVELAGADDCASVTASDLAAITTLDLDSTGLTSLQAGDFEGLSSLVNLRLRDNALSLDSFPGGLFKSLPPSIRYIDVSGNPGCPTHGAACYRPTPTIDVTVGTDTSGLTVARTGETVKLSLNYGGYRDPLGRPLLVPVWSQSSGTDVSMATTSDGRSASFFVPRIATDENAEFDMTVEPHFSSGDRTWFQTVLNNFWKEASSQVDLTFAPPVTLTVEDAWAPEGDPVEFTVMLNGTASDDVTVQYATASGAATEGTDYAGSSRTVTIAAGQTSGTIAIDTTDDMLSEDDETFTLTLSSPSPNAVLGTPANAVGAIVDDDRAPTPGNGKPLRVGFHLGGFGTTYPPDQYHLRDYQDHEGRDTTFDLIFSDAISARGPKIPGTQGDVTWWRERMSVGRIEQPPGTVIRVRYKGEWLAHGSEVWAVTVRAGKKDLSGVKVPKTTGTCTDARAICTSDGRKLTNTLWQQPLHRSRRPATGRADGRRAAQDCVRHAGVEPQRIALYIPADVQRSGDDRCSGPGRCTRGIRRGREQRHGRERRWDRLQHHDHPRRDRIGIGAASSDERLRRRRGDLYRAGDTALNGNGVTTALSGAGACRAADSHVLVRAGGP